MKVPDFHEQLGAFHEKLRNPAIQMAHYTSLINR